MPRGDRTGPNGFGSMTGRGMGYCAGHEAPGYMNPGAGMGYFGHGRGGRACGFGRGHRNMYRATGLPGRFRGQQSEVISPAFDKPGISPKQEAEMLKNQVSYMQESIDSINRRIKDLETGAAQAGEE
ncbi:MAG: hypothetical protein EHM28_03075 [Spirochaetaceae bacterium]|nr:MAG: hypothetical protein EHM28_03075 [Spirochaetaceae bacterium]